MTSADCMCPCHYDGLIDCAECCPVEIVTTVTTEPEPPLGTNAPPQGDFGKPTGDHDQPYTFDHLPSVTWPIPFKQLEFARLLIMRGKVRAAREDKAA